MSNRFFQWSGVVGDYEQIGQVEQVLILMFHVQLGTKILTFIEKVRIQTQ